MRVCRIITRLNTGGPALQVEVLNKLPVETLILSGRLENGEHGKEGCIRTLGRAICPWNDWKAYREIRRRLKEFKPDIVHTHTAKAGVLGRLAAWRLGIRCVHTYHGHTFYGYFSPRKTLLVRICEHLLSHITQKLVAISNSQKSDLEKYLRVGGTKIVMIPNGFDLSPFIRCAHTRQEAREELRWPIDKYISLFVGRPVPIKRVDRFIEYVKQRNHYGVVIEGGVPHDLMPLAYRAADEVCICSDNEGIPTVFIEATVSGTYVNVLNLVGGLKDLISMSYSEILETYQADRLRRDILTLYKEVINE